MSAISLEFVEMKHHFCADLTVGGQNTPKDNIADLQNLMFEIFLVTIFAVTQITLVISQSLLISK